MPSLTEIDLPKGRIADWLRAPLRKNRGVYVKVGVAAMMINCFALVSALFTMTVYDRVVPNNATDSLVGLSIGLALILAFDFTLKLLRAYFVDLAGARIDRDIGRSIFQRILELRLDLGRRSTGGLAALVREIEALRDFFASATITALVDVPFILVTVSVIALIGGSLVWVPLVLIPLVIGSALVTQPLLHRLSAQTLGEALGKQAVLVETIGSLETVKSANAGAMLSQRWDSMAPALADFTVSRLPMVSTSTACLPSASPRVWADSLCRRGWVTSALPITSGMRTRGTQTSDPPIRAITETVTRMNGTSTSAVIVADAKKSRSASISRTSAASPPVDRRPRSSRSSRMRWNMLRPMSRSMRAPARSTK